MHPFSFPSIALVKEDRQDKDRFEVGSPLRCVLQRREIGARMLEHPRPAAMTGLPTAVDIYRHTTVSVKAGTVQ